VRVAAEDEECAGCRGERASVVVLSANVVPEGVDGTCVDEQYRTRAGLEHHFEQQCAEVGAELRTLRVSVELHSRTLQGCLRRGCPGEVRERNLAEHTGVVVALDDDRATLLDDLDAFERIPTRMPDDVPEAPDLRTRVFLGRGEHCVERAHDAVNVRDEGDTPHRQR